MALIPCERCGRSISDKAAACPGCGRPRSTNAAAAAAAPVNVAKDPPAPSAQAVQQAPSAATDRTAGAHTRHECGVASKRIVSWRVLGVTAAGLITVVVISIIAATRGDHAPDSTRNDIDDRGSNAIAATPPTSPQPDPNLSTSVGTHEALVGRWMAAGANDTTIVEFLKDASWSMSGNVGSYAWADEHTVKIHYTDDGAHKDLDWQIQIDGDVLQTVDRLGWSSKWLRMRAEEKHSALAGRWRASDGSVAQFYGEGYWNWSPNIVGDYVWTSENTIKLGFIGDRGPMVLVWRVKIDGDELQTITERGVVTKWSRTKAP